MHCGRSQTASSAELVSVPSLPRAGLSLRRSLSRCPVHTHGSFAASTRQCEQLPGTLTARQRLHCASTRSPVMDARALSLFLRHVLVLSLSLSLSKSTRKSRSHWQIVEALLRNASFQTGGALASFQNRHPFTIRTSQSFERLECQNCRTLSSLIVPCT